MYSIPGRALHYVFKIGDRAKNAHFFRHILGMKVLRHEEFQAGCEAQCNGPYDNRWSKTMVGYGPEATHFVIELTYNYGVTNYEMGNDFGGITIKSPDILRCAAQHNYPVIKESEQYLLTSPDGYKFNIIDEKQLPLMVCDPIQQITLHVSNLETSKKYWHDVLRMKIVEENDSAVLLSYGVGQAKLRLLKIDERLNRAKAYGRIAFAVPSRMQTPIDIAIRDINGSILTPLVTLDTPGKAAVRVIILADPDGHEICYVDEEGFSQLSQMETDAHAELDSYISKDPYQLK